MMPFTFQTTANVALETGVTARVPGLLADARRVLLVTDKGVRGAGLTQATETAMIEAGICHLVFDDVVADPPQAVVESAVALARQFNAQAVIGIGGGSALDTAKLVAYLAGSGDRLDDVYGVGLAQGNRLPLILVPTTAGTGSEVTPIAIVTTQGHEKKGVVSSRLLPDWALLDPELTRGVPPDVTAATGIDAMVHAIEAFTSRVRKNPLSDLFALQSLGLLSVNIRSVLADGSNLEARGAMLLGSMLAGMAFANAPVAAVHALAYPLGARFHVPHGLSNALVLTEVLRFNLDAGEALYAELAAVFQTDVRQMPKRAAAEFFVASMATICRDCNIPTSLAAVGVREADLAQLATDAMKQTRLLVNNPRDLTFEDAFGIYQRCLRPDDT